MLIDKSGLSGKSDRAVLNFPDLERIKSKRQQIAGTANNINALAAEKVYPHIAAATLLRFEQDLTACTAGRNRLSRELAIAESSHCHCSHLRLGMLGAGRKNRSPLCTQSRRKRYVLLIAAANHSAVGQPHSSANTEPGIRTIGRPRGRAGAVNQRTLCGRKAIISAMYNLHSDIKISHLTKCLFFTNYCY